MDSRVPLDINSVHVVKLLEELSINEQPTFVSCNIEYYSQEDECIPNVNKKIINDGGQIILGWKIWQTDHLIESVFHAVWESNDGVLIDITPTPFKVERILFVRDEVTIYDGVQIDNVRINISNNGLVDDLIKVYEAKFRMQNKGSRAKDRSVKFINAEADDWTYLNGMGNLIHSMLANGFSKNRLCYCGKDKYKKCHGKVLAQILKRI